VCIAIGFVIQHGKGAVYAPVKLNTLFGRPFFGVMAAICRSTPVLRLFDITTRKVSSQKDGFSFTNCATVNAPLGH
jgi:hypothetical protein